MIYHYLFFNHGSNRNNLYGMFAMTILCLNLSDVAIITVKYFGYRCTIYNNK